MEVPLGTEWNTRLGFQRATLPNVVTKVRLLSLMLLSACTLNRVLAQMGALITPLEKQHS